jgi:hypothetical protein
LHVASRPADAIHPFCTYVILLHGWQHDRLYDVITGGVRTLRYTDDSRPPWLPADLAWSAELINKARERDLVLFYQACAKELRTLKTAQVKAAEQLPVDR